MEKKLPVKYKGFMHSTLKIIIITLTCFWQVPTSMNHTEHFGGMLVLLLCGGLCSKTTSGCLKLQIVPNPIYTVFFLIYMYL